MLILYVMKFKYVKQFRQWIELNEIEERDGRKEDGYFEDEIYQLFWNSYPELLERYEERGKFDCITYLKEADGGRRYKNGQRSRLKRRMLGSHALNAPFQESNGHHLTKDLVVFIPAVLHRSVPHNIWNGKGMKEINAFVKAWFLSKDENRIAEIISILGF